MKYLSKFWRPSEIPSTNCKICLELNCTKNCVMSYVAETQCLKQKVQTYTFP